MNNALGLIEVKGLVVMIDIADAMAKVSAIKIEKTERAKGFGWMTICISGDVAAVDAAIQAGRAIASENNWFITAKVIPRPAKGLTDLFMEVEKVAISVKNSQEFEVEDPVIDEPKVDTPIEISKNLKIEKENSTKKVAAKKQTKKTKK